MADPKIQFDCPERIAYNLMLHIGNKETIEKENPRKYWLNLYHECFLVVCRGVEPDKK